MAKSAASFKAFIMVLAVMGLSARAKTVLDESTGGRTLASSGTVFIPSPSTTINGALLTQVNAAGTTQLAFKGKNEATTNQVNLGIIGQAGGRKLSSIGFFGSSKTVNDAALTQVNAAVTNQLAIKGKNTATTNQVNVGVIGQTGGRKLSSTVRFLGPPKTVNDAALTQVNAAVIKQLAVKGKNTATTNQGNVGIIGQAGGRKLSSIGFFAPSKTFNDAALTQVNAAVTNQLAIKGKNEATINQANVGIIGQAGGRKLSSTRSGSLVTGPTVTGPNINTNVALNNQLNTALNNQVALGGKNVGGIIQGNVGGIGQGKK